MSKVARRKQLLSSSAAVPAAVDGITTSYSAPAVAPPPLHGPDGKRIRVVHIVAELAPFARSGGLGEASTVWRGFNRRAVFRPRS